MRVTRDAFCVRRNGSAATTLFRRRRRAASRRGIPQNRGRNGTVTVIVILVLLLLSGLVLQYVRQGVQDRRQMNLEFLRLQAFECARAALASDFAGDAVVELPNGVRGAGLTVSVSVTAEAGRRTVRVECPAGDPYGVRLTLSGNTGTGQPNEQE